MVRDGEGGGMDGRKVWMDGRSLRLVETIQGGLYPKVHGWLNLRRA